MEGQSTHTLRLDQLADLLRARVAEDPKPQDGGPKPNDRGWNSEDGRQMTKDGDS